MRFLFRILIAAFFLLAINPIAKAQVSTQDRQALIDLYNSTDGSNWINSTNWLNDDVSTWFGVTVSGNRVTQIILANNNLSGTIPPSLGDLTNLQTLNLGYNNLFDTIPFSLCNLINLQYFFLNVNNNISGVIPPNIGNLTNLIRIDFSSNQLSGTIPASFSNCLSLQNLYLEYNMLTGAIPESLGNLTNLQNVFLDDNQLSGSIPASFANLTYLPRLWLYDNQFTFAGMEGIANIAPGSSYGTLNNIYAPQATIPLYNNNNTLSISVGGTPANDTFRWYRNGVLISTKVGDSTYSITGNGTYWAVATNSVATQLTLYSDTLKIDNFGIVPPTIKSFTPNSTCPGTSTPVFIVGANFTGADSVTTVTIGGATVDSFSINSATSITAYVSNGTTGKVAVANAGGTSTSDSVFTFGIGHTAYAYIANGGDSTVSVINASANKVVAKVAVGLSPYDVCVSADGTKAYVVNYIGNTISVINTTTNIVVATVPVGSGPWSICVSPDGTKAYTANNTDNTVSVVNTITNTVIATVSVGVKPDAVCVSPDGSKVYVANNNDNTVSVISTSTNRVIATMPVGTSPLAISISADGYTVYVTNANNNTISVINTSTNAVTATVAVGSFPSAVCVSPDGLKVYVTNEGDNTTSVINATTYAVMSTIAVGKSPAGVCVSPDGREAYVSNNNSNSISVISTATNTIISTISVGTQPGTTGNIFANIPTPCGTAPLPTVFSFTPNGTCPGTSIPVFITGENFTDSITAVTVGGAAVDSFHINSSSSITAYISNGITGKIALVNGKATATSDSVFTFGMGHTAYLYLPDTGDTSVVVYKVETAFAIAPSNYIKVGNTPSGITSSLDGSNVYVSNIQDNTISVINTITGTVTATIPVGKSPDGLCISPNGATLYVANSKSNTLSMINTATNTILTTLNVGNNPTGICITPDGKTVYIINSNDNTVGVISTATNTTVAVVPVGHLPTSISISPDGTRVYTTNFSDGTISVINTAINSVIATVGVGVNPSGSCVNPTGTKVYVVNQSSNTVSIINTVTNQILSTFNTGGNLPTGVSISPDGTKICVICAGSNEVIYFDAITNANIYDYVGIGNKSYPLGNFIANVPTPCGAPPPPVILSFTPNSTCPGTSIPVFITGANLTGTSKVTVGGAAVDSFRVNSISSITAYVSKGTTGKIAVTNGGGTATSDSVFTFGIGHTAFAYVANGSANTSSDGTVSVINTVTNKLVTTLKVGNSPWGVTATPDGTKVYITNSFSNSVSVINTANNTIMATVAVGKKPWGISVTPDGSKVYVVNSKDNTISVINTATNTVTATVVIGGIINLWDVCISPDGTKAYVTNGANNTLVIINTATDKVTATVALDSSPWGISTSPDGSKIYITNSFSNTLSVISSSTNTLIDKIPVGNTPWGTSVSPDGMKVYVTNTSDSTVSVVNTISDTVEATIKVGREPQGISFRPDGLRAYIAISGSDSLSIINTVADTLMGKVLVGNAPESYGNFIANVPRLCGINPPPDIALFFPNSACAGTTDTIVGSGFTRATAVSFGGVSASSYTVVNDDTIIAIVGEGASGNVQVSTPSGTGSLDGFVFLMPTPLAPIMGDSAICINQSITLTDTTKGGVWSSSNSSVATVNGGIVTGIFADTATIIYTDTIGCSHDVTHKIQVMGSTPITNASPTPATCDNTAGGSIAVTVSGKENPYQVAFEGIRYDVPYTIPNLLPGLYNIAIYNSAGCKVDTLSSIPVLLTIDANCDTLYVPMAFVPTTTSAGVTPVLKPFGGGASIKSVLFRVYNRYGNLVFESHSLDNGWDGRINGTLQDIGTYVWQLDYSYGINKTKHNKGTSVLMK